MGGWKAYVVNAAGDIQPQRPSWRVRFLPSGGPKYSPLKDPRTKIFVRPLGQPYLWSEERHEFSRDFRRWTVTAIIVGSLILPHAVIGGFSRFRGGDSTLRQRAFMMGWLVVGQFIGTLNLVTLTAPRKVKRQRKWRLFSLVTTNLVLAIGIAFAVGGFVESGRMMRDFGYCIKIPGAGTSLVSGE